MQSSGDDQQQEEQHQHGGPHGRAAGLDPRGFLSAVEPLDAGSQRGYRRLASGSLGIALQRECRATLQQFGHGHGNNRRARGRQHGRRDNPGRIHRTQAGPHGDRAQGQHGHTRSVDGQEQRHGVRGHPGAVVEGLQLLHGLQTKWCRRISQPEDVCREVHDHCAHCGVVGRNVREQAAHNRRQGASERGHEACIAKYAHESEPQRHHAQQSDGDLHGAVRRVDAGIHDLGHRPVESGEQNRDRDEEDKDRVEQEARPGLFLYHRQQRETRKGSETGPLPTERRMTWCGANWLARTLYD